MKLLSAALILSLFTLLPVSGQSEIVGTWESDMDDKFSDELHVWQFREDGILLQNEYYEGDLECVYAFEYAVNGDEVTIEKGLNWEYDSDTGEFELYEDFTEEDVVIDATFVVSQGDLSLSMTNESILRGIVAAMLADEDVDIDPIELGLDYDFENEDLVISDDELVAAMQKFMIVTVAAVFEFETGTELDVDLDGDLEDAVNSMVVAIFLVELESTLGVVADDLETDLDGDPVEVVTAVFEELGILQSDVDDEDQEALRSAIEDLSELNEMVADIEAVALSFGDLEFDRSEREILAPSQFVLPGGRTAIAEDSWGNLKRRFSR